MRNKIKINRQTKKILKKAQKRPPKKTINITKENSKKRKKKKIESKQTPKKLLKNIQKRQKTREKNFYPKKHHPPLKNEKLVNIQSKQIEKPKKKLKRGKKNLLRKNLFDQKQVANPKQPKLPSYSQLKYGWVLVHTVWENVFFLGAPWS